MVDYSFLRLKTSLNEALNVGNPNITDDSFNYYESIHLIPNEMYCQITNCDSGITFAGDYKAKILTMCGNEIEEITTQVAIYELNDIRGLNQIAFEFYFKKDYGLEPIILCLEHTESNQKFYSNPFVCTEILKEQTSFFEYRSYGYFYGISYDKFDGYQAIRLNVYYDYPENKTEVGEYYQISTKNTISDRALYKQSYKYSTVEINPFTYERANIMLIHDVIYCDGTRISNKPQLTSEERLGDSNVFPSNMDLFKDLNDTKCYELQIFEELELLVKLPFGNYNNDSHPTEWLMSFNLQILNIDGLIVQLRKYSDDSIIETFTQSDMSINITEVFSDLGTLENDTKYYFTVSQGIKSELSEFNGIQDKDTWWFRLKEHDYSSEDYSTIDYDA